MKKIYLACPYTHEDSKVRRDRFAQANKTAGELMKAGNIVFSPISHSHPVSLTLGNENNGKFWIKQDKAFIDWCDELYVLCIDGWDESVGIKEEVDYAKKLGKKVFWLK